MSLAKYQLLSAAGPFSNHLLAINVKLLVKGGAIADAHRSRLAIPFEMPAELVRFDDRM